MQTATRNNAAIRAENGVTKRKRERERERGRRARAEQSGDKSPEKGLLARTRRTKESGRKTLNYDVTREKGLRRKQNNGVGRQLSPSSSWRSSWPTYSACLRGRRVRQRNWSVEEWQCSGGTEKWALQIIICRRAQWVLTTSRLKTNKHGIVLYEYFLNVQITHVNPFTMNIHI